MTESYFKKLDMQIPLLFINMSIFVEISVTCQQELSHYKHFRGRRK